MKAILMSLQPKWCERIATNEAGKKKTIEVRKTYPKEFLKEYFLASTFEPFKVYIYCTQGKDILAVSRYSDKSVFLWNESDVDRYNIDMVRNGKIIGEFICDNIDLYAYGDLSYPTPAYDGDPSFCDCGEGYWITVGDLKKTQLTYEELCAYGKSKALYGWHISDLVIYDEPKQLSDFGVERAPQSWFYVNEK